jgi:hypothetical protein
MPRISKIPVLMRGNSCKIAGFWQPPKSGYATGDFSWDRQKEVLFRAKNFGDSRAGETDLVFLEKL